MPDEMKAEDREEQNREETEEDQDQKQDHHIPAPPLHKRHRKKHWDHLPGSKRKSIRSFKSPGRK
jgi:hypothetical protein